MSQTFRDPGDYQTTKRMADKMKAIPIPADLTGVRVLDVGCDHGFWSRLASERGAEYVLGVDRGRWVRQKGFVDLAAQNNAKGWHRCEFQNHDLGKVWPELGTFDLIFCFSLYHHWYGQCGNHAAIWKWLYDHLAKPHGVLLWEGPHSTRDGTARSVTRDAGDYTRESILGAARGFFDVEIVGEALHRAHREVWRAIPALGETDDDDDVGGSSMQGSGSSKPGVQRTKVQRSVQDGRVGAVSGHPEPESAGTRALGRGPGRSDSGNGTRHEDRPSAVVAGVAPVPRPDPSSRASRKRRKKPGTIPGGGSAAESTARWAIEQRRPDLVHPEWAIILGGGHEVWDEVLEWEALYGQHWDGVIIAANDVGSHWPRDLDHWCTLHPEKMAGWRTAREANNFSNSFITWGRRAKIMDCQVRPWAGGSSGMLAIQVAQIVGCTKAILCGIPMTPTPHFAESVVHGPSPWKAVAGHWRAWTRQWAKMEGWVKSMRGRTKQEFGYPTLEWLHEPKEEDEPG